LNIIFIAIYSFKDVYPLFVPSLWGQENSEPAKVAQVILRLAVSDRLPAHLLLGSDAVRYAGEAEATRSADADRWREISVSTDAGAPGALPALPW
jgi:hypothetical protein